jgi:hypothetical protein
MPDWGSILSEIGQTKSAQGKVDFDAVRRKYLAALRKHTGRDVILYASKFTQQVPPEAAAVIAINDEDVQGFMAVMHGLKGKSIDLILHSPGGSLEATESLVTYIRSKFDDVRVIVPHLALSAGTMIAFSANRIVMGKHSFLGPTDPQILMTTPLGPRMIAAQAIIEQFEVAKKECQDRANMPAWAPMLQQYGPDLLVRCSHVSALSKKLVEKWMTEYMFSGEPNAAEKASQIATWITTHKEFGSHARHLARVEMESHDLKIERLEDDQDLQELVLSVFHATTQTFDGTPCVKIIENNLGKAFVKSIQQVVVQQGSAAPAAPGGPPENPKLKQAIRDLLKPA